MSSWWMLTTPRHLAALQPASELRGQLPPPWHSCSHREPRPTSANHRVYLTHPFEKMADASNPACSIPWEPTFWHTERTDARQTKSMCSSQPSRKGNQTAAEGPFVLLGIRRCGSLLPTSKNPSLSLASTALLSQVTLITAAFSATPFVHNYVASRA